MSQKTISEGIESILKKQVTLNFERVIADFGELYRYKAKTPFGTYLFYQSHNSNVLCRISFENTLLHGECIKGSYAKSVEEAIMFCQNDYRKRLCDSLYLIGRKEEENE